MTDPAILEQIISQFPTFAGMGKIPEISDLLTQAASENWQPPRLLAALWSTDWWKNTPESSRSWEARKLVDPATAGQQAHTMAANVIATSTSLGIHLSPAEVAWYSELASSGGWDQTALTRSLVDNTTRDRFRAGTIGSTQDSLRATAANYGVTVGPESSFKWASDITTGRQTQQGFEDWARRQAKANFPALAKEIDSGLTVRQIADPYFQIASQTLGVDPNSMSLSDPKWSAALQNRDAKGNITGPMTQQDWSRHIMEDPQYQFEKSANGISAGLQLRDSLAKTFGLTA